jgi:hypothetical protein
MDCYHKQKRWKTVDKKLRQLMDNALNVINFENIDNNINKNEPIHQNSTQLLVLKSIEDNIHKLQNKISQIEANGKENTFLSLNEQCIQLFAKLDSMGDLNHHNSSALRNRRKECYLLLEKLSKQLNVLAMDNLKKLLNSVKSLNSNDLELTKLISDINLFIINNKNASIKDIDEYRYLLQDKKIHF